MSLEYQLLLDMIRNEDKDFVLDLIIALSKRNYNNSFSSITDLYRAAKQRGDVRADILLDSISRQIKKERGAQALLDYFKSIGEAA